MRLRPCVLMLGLLSALSLCGSVVWGEEPPAAGQTLTPQEQLRQTQAQIDDMAARLAKNGGSADEWATLARSYLTFKQFDKAKDAARHVIELEPKQVGPLMLLAEAQMAAAPHGGKLPADFVATLRQVLALDAHNVNGLYYVGLDEAQAGHAAKARSLWLDLLARLPADDPARPDLTKRLDALPKK